MASTIPFSPGRYHADPRWWEDSGMSEADNEDDDGRLVIDESPRSPSPQPEEDDDDDEEAERTYYLAYYQRSLAEYINLLLPREP